MVIGSGFGLASCSGGAGSLAREACVHIDRSIHLYQQASTVSDPSHAAELRQQASAQLRDALPLVARAALRDPQWQALATTVSENSRVSESALITALQDQCAATSDSNPFETPAPSSVPPPATTGDTTSTR